jgi:hypothetical protein
MGLRSKSLRVLNQGKLSPQRGLRGLRKVKQRSNDFSETLTTIHKPREEAYPLSLHTVGGCKKLDFSTSFSMHL